MERQRVGTSSLPSNHRVRPMSAAELRRGEQSALHCSGSRTLQVRKPSPSKKTYRKDALFLPPGNFARAPPSQASPPFSTAPSPR